MKYIYIVRGLYKPPCNGLWSDLISFKSIHVYKYIHDTNHDYVVNVRIKEPLYRSFFVIDNYLFSVNNCHNIGMLKMVKKVILLA